MNKKILLIDDEESVRKAMSAVLRKTGYDVSVCADGSEAIETLKRLSFDLIILDMNMPRMDGLMFLQHVRDHNITAVPVLMVTGSTDPDLKAKSYKLGVYDFINKPEQTEVMLKRIENGIKIGDMMNFNEFIKTELFMAKKLQTYLYPPSSIETDTVHIRTVLKPLSDIGGDLYDYIEFRDGRIVFFVADVSGHSIPAAMYTAIVKMLFRNAIRETDNPAEILTMMNSELSGNIPIESFVTMFCGLLDPSKSLLYYANAGHPYPLMLSGGVISELEGSDSFLGPIKDARYSLFTSTVMPNDAVCVFTDGMFEVDEQGNEMNDRWIRDILGHDTLSLNDKYETIRNRLLGDRNRSNDDCTLMMVCIK